MRFLAYALTSFLAGETGVTGNRLNIVAMRQGNHRAIFTATHILFVQDLGEKNSVKHFVKIQAIENQFLLVLIFKVTIVFCLCFDDVGNSSR